jgi:hypothetical protein
MTYTNFNAKFGTNRDKRRVWIEGNRLIKHAWNAKETHYSVYYTTFANTPVVVLRKLETGEKRVSGKDTKPIIDLCNDRIGPHLNNCERVCIELTDETLTISPSA